MALIPLRSRIVSRANIRRAALSVFRKRDSEDITPFNFVEEQFPEFIRTEYPRMVEFAKKYFLFIAGTENGKIDDIKDIDKTTDDYIFLLRKEFSYNSAKFNFLTDKEFIRTAKLFYSSKGTEESIRFLFRVMFNDNVDVEYPGENLFTPSQAKWFQLRAFRVKLLGNSRPANEFIGSFLTLRNSTGEKQPITVYNVNDLTQKLSENEPSFIFEILFEDEIFINIDIGDIIEGDDFQAEILPTISKVVVVDPGERFRFGQIIRFDSTAGSGAIGIVSGVTVNGGIRNIKILRFGSNYESSFYVSIFPSGVFTDTGSSFETTGDGDINTFIEDAYAGYEESVDSFRSDYALNDSPDQFPFYSATTYTGQFVSQFRSRQFQFQENQSGALLLALMGPISTYPGVYLDRKGMASNSSYLQDNNYYQTFSYVIKTKSDISQYKDVVTSFVHPAGMKMFGEKSQEHVFDLESTIKLSEVNEIIDNKRGILKARLQVEVRAEGVFPFNNGLRSSSFTKYKSESSGNLTLINNLETDIIDTNTYSAIASGTLRVV